MTTKCKKKMGLRPLTRTVAGILTLRLEAREIGPIPGSAGRAGPFISGWARAIEEGSFDHVAAILAEALVPSIEKAGLEATTLLRRGDFGLPKWGATTTCTASGQRLSLTLVGWQPILWRWHPFIDRMVQIDDLPGEQFRPTVVPFPRVAAAVP